MDLLEKRRRKEAIKLLCTSNPETIEKFGEKLIIPAFRRAATGVPAYQKILKEHNVDIKKVIDKESYKRLVPIIDKYDTFESFEIEELCMGGTIKDMKLAMTSSGFSGTYSYGISTNFNLKTIARSIDTALDYIFDISNKETFLVNCVPMGVKISTSLTLAETSVRSDMAIAAIKKFSPKFAQTIIVSDPYFLKKLVEEGNEQRLDWKRLNVSLIFGEDWFSESFRSYMAQMLNLDIDHPEGRFIGTTMGIAELDLNLFHESMHSMLIRRKTLEDKDLKAALFGKNTISSPILFHYYPHRVFLEALPEESEDKELIFSMLSPHMHVPLLRYNSKDKGIIFSYNRMKAILEQFGYNNLIPELKLPMVAVGGRQGRFIEIERKQIYPEDIKQGLYEDFTVAFNTTGYFRLSKDTNGAKLEIQLKKGTVLTEELRQRFERALLKYSPTSLPIITYPYQEFPYGMELDYERKFKNV